VNWTSVTDYMTSQVDGTLLYPAAGMLVMAIEAVRKMTTNIANIMAYKLRDVNLVSALVIPEGEDGIEAQLHLHSHGDVSSARDARAWEFWLYTVSAGEWKLHCTGVASVEQQGTSIWTFLPPPFSFAHQEFYY
jgi:hypothetical protein